MKYGNGCDLCESDFNLLDVDAEHLDFGLQTDLSLMTLEDGRAILKSTTSYNNVLDGDQLLYSSEYEINFCPKCGRPLNEKDALYFYRQRIKAFICDEVLNGKGKTKDDVIKEMTERAVPLKEIELAIQELIEDGFLTTMVIGDSYYLEQTED